MKPTISADGFSTERTRTRPPPRIRRRSTRCSREATSMIQPLVPEIRTNGELSLMFFGGIVQPRGQQAAAGRRVPRAGAAGRDGSCGDDPPPALVEHARGLLDACAPGCLYARVDVVVDREAIRADGSRARGAEPLPRTRPAAARAFALRDSAHRVTAYADGRASAPSARIRGAFLAAFPANACPATPFAAQRACQDVQTAS